MWFKIKYLFNKLFRKKIVIPLVRKGVKTGMWVECYKGDSTYKKLIKVYGFPLPKTIEAVPLEEN